MKCFDHVRWVRGDATTGYLFDARLGSVIALNESSAVILEALADGADEEAVVQALIERCGAGELAARDDASAFLGTLMELRLVQP